MTNFAQLDQYLSSDESPEDCMMLSDLDGFLTGVVCSPEIIPQAEWLEKALGSSERVPEWVTDTLVDRHAQILLGLTSEAPFVEPVFWQAKEGHVIAMDWCEGFMDAVALRPKKWLRLTESGTGGRLITPIMVHMIDQNGDSVLRIPQEDLDSALAEAADKIPGVAVGIFQFWQ